MSTCLREPAFNSELLMSLVIESEEIGGVVMEVPTPTIIASAPLELVLAVSLGLLVLLIIGICFSDPPLASMTALEGAARPTRKAATTLPPEKNTVSAISFDDAEEEAEAAEEEEAEKEPAEEEAADVGAAARAPAAPPSAARGKRPAKSPGRKAPAKSPARPAKSPARGRGGGAGAAGNSGQDGGDGGGSSGGGGSGSQYIQINGERYDRSLIELAQTLRAAKSNFTLGRPDAVKLWQDAKDGPGVTDTERKTLAFIRDMYGMTAEAKSFLTAQIEVTPSGSSYYATIPGRLRGEPSTVVDRAMWDEISMLARDGNIDLADARKLWAAAQDGPGVTTTERRTMERALKDHNFTRGARDFLERQLASLGSE